MVPGKHPGGGARRRAVIPSDGTPLEPSTHTPDTEHEHLVRMVCACLTAGLVTVAEISCRSEDEVRALLAARGGHLQLLGARRSNPSPPPVPPSPDRGIDLDGTARAS